MRLPTSRQIDWNTDVEPVKCTPASRGSASTSRVTVTASPGTKLITPSGNPASRSTSMMRQLDNDAVVAGFQTTVLPRIAGAVQRLPPMAEKLNGEIA